MKILSFPYHAPYQSNLSKVLKQSNIDFYICEGMIDGVNWGNNNTNMTSNDRNSNHIKFIDKKEMKKMLENDRFDLIIYPTVDYWGFSNELEKINETPSIKCHATIFKLNPSLLLKSGYLKNNENIVHVTPYMEKRRDNDIYIKYGLDPNDYKNYDFERKTNTIPIYPINRFRETHTVSGYEWNSIISLLNVKLLGLNNEDFNGENLSYDEYLKKLSLSLFGVNLSKYKHTSISNLEMMLNGIAIVARKEPYDLYPDFDMKSAYYQYDKGCMVVANNITEMYLQMKKIMNDRNKTKNISETARQTILKHYSFEQFKNKWLEVIENCL